MIRTLLLASFLLVSLAQSKHTGSKIRVSDQGAALIGKQIWKNECSGTKDGLLG